MAPPELTHDLALEIQEAMIQEFLRPEFRYKLRDALDGSEGDMVKQAHARRDVCMAVEIPLLAKFGYEATEEAVHQHSLALGKLLHDCPDLVEKNQTLTRLVNPTMDVYEDDHIAAD
mmetsp:Transcript_71238/g.157260  ORF Transcript_71238/g.157260 Transcript_71238/m.157260 type:complete len:117 (+) Transcript_71238:38-388(+)